MKSFIQLSFSLLAATLVVAQFEPPASVCPEGKFEKCCQQAVDPSDTAVRDELNAAQIDPSTVVGQVGVNCHPTSSDTECVSPEVHLCCDNFAPIAPESILVLDCTAVDNGSF